MFVHENNWWVVEYDFTKLFDNLDKLTYYIELVDRIHKV